MSRSSSNERRIARRFALIGLAGTSVMLSASLLQSSPALPGGEAWTRGLESLTDGHPVRIMVGAALSPLGGALAAAGCLAVFFALRPAGAGVAGVAAGGFVQWFVSYAAYGAGRPLIAQLHRASELAADPRLVVEATTFWNVHRALAGVGLFVGSLFFFFTLLFRSTHLPRGLAAAAPVLWVPLIRLTPLLPTGGGAFWTAYLDLVGVVFFSALVAGVGRSQELE